MDATNQGIQWHLGNGPAVELNGHDGSLVN